MDAPTRRRRAACAVLDPVLGEDDLLTALWLQHDTMRGEAVSDIIRYVDAVAERFILDAATRKRLYEGLHRALRLGDGDLPIDPWPAMLVVRPSAAAPRTAAAAPAPAPWATEPRYAAQPPTFPQAQVPADTPLYTPPIAPPIAPPVAPPIAPAYAPATPPVDLAAQVPPPAAPAQAPAPWAAAPADAQPLTAPAAALPMAPPVVAAAPVPAPAPALQVAGVPPALPAVAAVAPGAGGPAWTPESGVPAEQAVFAELIAHIAAEIIQSHSADFAEWRASWLSLLERQSSATPQRMQLIAACRDLSPEQTSAELLRRWRMPLPASQLAQQTHQLYVALCEALGPVGADQVLTRAVRKAEQSPAARVYSPRKLM